MVGEVTARRGGSAHRFYISSPYLGLRKEREAAKKLITRQNHAYGDSYGGAPDPLVETCQRDVRSSDHYVLILGERYGSRQTDYDGKSLTELEFEAALEAGLTLHAFFLGFVSDSRYGIDRDTGAQESLAAFRRAVSEHCVPVDCSDQEDGRSGWNVLVEQITALAANPPPVRSKSSEHNRKDNAFRNALLVRLRKQMLLSSSAWEMRQASYELESYLAAFPYDIEARILNDQLQRAMRRENTIKKRQQDFVGPVQESPKYSSSHLRFIFLMLTGVVIFIFVKYILSNYR